MTLNILASVGHNCANRSDDVKAVQARLNGLMQPPRLALEVDGRCGPKTQAMIADFQKNVVGMAHPDYRIDKQGKTIAALNDANSTAKWGGIVGATATFIVDVAEMTVGKVFDLPKDASEVEREAIEELYTALRIQNHNRAQNVLIRMVSDGAFDVFRSGLVALKRGGRYKEFIKMVAYLHNSGLNDDQIVRVLKRLDGPDGDIFALASAFSTVPAFGDAIVAFANAEKHAIHLSSLKFAAAMATAFKAGQISVALRAMHSLAKGVGSGAQAANICQDTLKRVDMHAATSAVAKGFFSVAGVMTTVSGSLGDAAAQSVVEAAVQGLTRGALREGQVAAFVRKLNSGGPSELQALRNAAGMSIEAIIKHIASFV